MQEAKDSSAIENIVTTHDDIYQGDLFPQGPSDAAKEVLRYRQALFAGFEQVEATIVALMGDLERFINDDSRFDADPLIKMALIHHQFESIHPFYDGNGRTGRIINVLYLVKQGLLNIPVLYLSRHIVQTKPEYYRLLRAVREQDAWEDWVFYMLQAIEVTARDTIETIRDIRDALHDAKHGIRDQYQFYSQNLINNLFTHPYTKIEFVQHDLKVSRLTATKYLDALTEGGFLRKHKKGRNNYYINLALNAILTRDSMKRGS